MRIKTCFDRLSDANRKALIPYITAGDPKDKTVDIMHRLVDSGADIIELGFPFSDPVADGPVIAAAHERALANQTTLDDVFSMVSTFRATNRDTPVILMGYLNPIEVMGYSVFASKMARAGVDGVLVVDLPPEFATDLKMYLTDEEIDMINLITPTTSDERIRKICATASGFVYYVSLKGVTGSAQPDLDSVRSRVEHIKTFTDVPVGVGFGIRDGASAKAISEVADAAVTGTVLVLELSNYQEIGESSIDKVCEHLSSMRTAMDNC